MFKLGLMFHQVLPVHIVSSLESSSSAKDWSNLRSFLYHAACPDFRKIDVRSASFRNLLFDSQKPAGCEAAGFSSLPWIYHRV